MRWYADKMIVLLALTVLLVMGCGNARPQDEAVADPERALLEGADLSAAQDEAAASPERALPEWADLAAAYDAGVAASGSPIENLTLPLEHFDSGRVRAVLKAEQATVADEDYVRAGKVRITLFNERGQQEGWLMAEQCLFNRNEKRVYCRGAVTLELQEVVVSGKDLYWSLVQQRVMVISDAQVVVKQWKRSTGRGE